MFTLQDNFLPSYINGEEAEEESLYQELFPSEERNSVSGLTDAQTTDKSKDASEEQEVTDPDNLEPDNRDSASGGSSQGSQLDQNKSFNSSTSSESWWLLKIIYIIVGGVELIINFAKVCTVLCPHSTHQQFNLIYCTSHDLNDGQQFQSELLMAALMDIMDHKHFQFSRSGV